jgi:glycosyltransferase involved in cell wall biosynthesis
MHERPVISVVIPCYNYARYLPEAIESVVNQSYEPVQVVIVDDGSSDETASVAAAFPCVRYIHQSNTGLAAARNRGIRESTGRFLLFLDADDRLCPGALESGARAAAEHPGCGFVYGRFRFVDAGGQTLDSWDPPPDNPDTYLGLFGGNHIAMCATVLFPRAVLEQVGGFRPELRASEDYDLYFRIARLYPYFRHSGLMAECRRHGRNMSLDAALMLRSTLQVVRAQHQHVGRDAQRRRAYRQVRRIWRDYYGSLLLQQIKHRWRAHEFARAGWECAVLLRNAPATLLRSAGRLLRQNIRGWLGGGQAARVRRILGPGAFHRLTPASKDFGYDRGTPIDRYYIEHALVQHIPDIQGRVLEIKDDTYTRRFGGSRVTHSDVLDVIAHNPRATIIADLRDAPQIPSDTFDCVIVTQTLQLIYELQCAVRTLHRVLKPGGILLATLPGISQIARDGFNRWEDHWRFTSASARKLFTDVFGTDNVAVAVHGNLCATVNFLDARAAEELSARELDHLDPDYQLVISVRAVKS